MVRNHQVALCVLLAFAGCNKPATTEPTAAERAQIYLAAKAELDQVKEAEEKTESLYQRALAVSNGEVPEDIYEDYIATMELHKQRRAAAEKTMQENSPLQP